MPRLIVSKKAEVLAEYTLSRRSVINIGSAKGNNIVIPDKNVSENHATITKTSSGYEIRDNNTLAGTRINDRTIAVSALTEGDSIGISVYTLDFIPDLRRRTAEDVSEQIQKSFGLLGIYGKFEGKKFRINPGDTYIGREQISPKGIENSIVLAGDMTASKGHAKITCADGRCAIIDVGSTGGVAVNGEKVGQLNERAIKPGDEIAIGRTIFRFCDDGADDYSVPRRQDILLLKLRRPASLALTALVVAAAGWLLFGGIAGVRVINDRPRKIELAISRNWAAPNQPPTTPVEYDISSSPAVGDLNGDGINDVVTLNASGMLTAVSGKTGDPLWKPVEIFNPGKSSPLIHDMNNDGIPDVCIVSDASIMYIVDGQTGGVIRREVLGGSISELSPAVGDLNGDDKPDLVIASEEGMVHFVYAPGFEEGMEKFTEFIEGPIYAGPVIATSKKLAPVVVVATNNGKLFFFDGKSRGKKTVDLVEKTGKAHLISAPPAVGDLNGDDIPEVVVQSNVPQYISAIDLSRFDVKWTYFVEPIPPSGIKHNASPVIGDANGDGLNDVMMVSANGAAYALKGETGYPAGELLWKLQLPEAGRIISSPALGNLDKNGLMNLVVGAEDGTVFVLRNAPKRREMEVAASLKASNAPITSSVAIGDVSGSGHVDIVATNNAGAIQMINTNVSTFKRRLSWAMYLGDPLRSGSAVLDESMRPYFVKIAVGCLVLAIYLVIKAQRNRKRAAKRPRVAYV